MKKSPSVFCLLFLLLRAVVVAQESSDAALAQPATSQDASRGENSSPLMMFHRRTPGGGGEHHEPGEGSDPIHDGRNLRFDRHDDEGDGGENQQRGDLNAQGGIAERQIDQRVQEGNKFGDQDDINQQREQGARSLARLQAMQEKTWIDHIMEIIGNLVRTVLRLKDAIVEKASASWQGRGNLRPAQRDFRNQILGVQRTSSFVGNATIVKKINALEAQLNTWIAQHTWIAQQEPTAFSMDLDEKAQKMLDLVKQDYLQDINPSSLLEGDRKCINLICLSWAYYFHKNDTELLRALYQNLFQDTYEELQVTCLESLPEGLEPSIDEQAELIRETLARNLHQSSSIAKYWIEFARFQNASEPLLRNIAYKIFDEKNSVCPPNYVSNQPLTPPQLSYRLISIVRQIAPSLNIPLSERLNYTQEWARSRQGRMSDNEMTTLLNEIRLNGPRMGLPLAVDGRGLF